MQYLIYANFKYIHQTACKLHACMQLHVCYMHAITCTHIACMLHACCTHVNAHMQCLHVARMHMHACNWVKYSHVAYMHNKSSRSCFAYVCMHAHVYT